jgi:xanthine dehydrogenase accessory factor
METGFYRLIIRWIEQGAACALATVVKAEGSVPRHPGAKMLVRADGMTEGTVGGGALEVAVVEAAGDVIRRGEPELLSFELKADLEMACGGSAEVFIEPLLPADRLYIFGGGHVGLALSRLAAQVNFIVTVIDDRPDYATAKRFPEVSGFVHSYDPEAWQDLTFDDNTFCVVMTPSHATDASVVKALMRRRPRYIGMIGSRQKRKAVERVLQDDGCDPERVAELRTPIGIPIGAETSDEIAISIIAELVRERRVNEEE